MPADLLMPLFAVMLLANALLVAAAIRSLRRGNESGDANPWAQRPVPEPRRVPVARPAAPEPASPAEREPPANPVEPAPEASAPVRPRRTTAAGSMPPGAKARAARHAESAEIGTTARLIERPPAPTSPSPEPAASNGKRRGRRRFSLPPLDEDHEKVSRSIETFLGGPEPAADIAVAADDPPGQADATRGAGRVLTIALVAVTGVPGVDAVAIPRRNARAARRPHEDSLTEEALAFVERAIRGAARATDVVSVGSGAVFRIDLPATGELAARAYLRRVRATVDPMLEATDRPLRIAVATATVLDEPIREALGRAEHRLATAIDAARLADAGDAEGGDDSETGEETRRPRAAAD